MGLLSHILELERRWAAAKEQPLNATAAHYESESNDFYAWCEKQNFSHAALFRRDGDVFYIIKAVGLDAETIARSYSSKDFWDGTLQTEAGWQSVSREEAAFASFNQFLSDDVRNKAQTLHFIKLEDSVLMLVQEDDDFTLAANSETVKRDIIQILRTQPAPEDMHATAAAVVKGLQIADAALLVLSVRTAVENAIKPVSFRDETAKEKILQTIYHEIHRMCAILFQRPNCCMPGKNGELKIAFFSKNGTDEQLLRFHIAQTLASAIALPEKDVTLRTAGSSPDTQGIMSFLQD
ncbi:MAG: hypothetical protein K2O09_03225 [Treponemataceae bacterium]|nr:hypothetical protein [Treponemataceae bacterium]